MFQLWTAREKTKPKTDTARILVVYLRTMEITEREYLEDVEGLAQEVLRRFFEDGDEVSDAIHEAVDGSQWVIYYARARRTLEYSPNEDAVFDDGEFLGRIGSMGEFLTLAAFCAMRADVSAKVQELMAERDLKEGAEA
jgi:hypothetical protein